MKFIPSFPIAKAAVASSQTRSTTLGGDDTDILVLCIYLLGKQPQTRKFYFRFDKNKGPSWKVYDISVICMVLGPEISQALLFVHACFSNSCLFDTVSQIHGKKSFKVMLC